MRNKPGLFLHGGPKICIRFIVAIITYQINPAFDFRDKS